MLLITWDDSLSPEEYCEVVSSTAPLLKCGVKEAAGKYFHQKALAQLGITGNDESSPVDEEEEDETLLNKISSSSLHCGAGEHNGSAREGWLLWTDWDRKPSRKATLEANKKDLYALLGLKDQRWLATSNDIKKAYQRQALLHHPDKTCAGVTDEAEKSRLEERFKIVQDAFETLSDPAKRRKYDSLDEFDDSLPIKCRPEDFYKVFGNTFRRLARWSVNTPVPQLGTADDPYKTVQSFYDFWFSFKSWREFPHDDEEDPESAECREQRRWIERENARLRSKGKKEETRRLKSWIEHVQSIDPRVAAHKEKVQAEKEAKKQEKIRAQQAKEEEKRRVEEEQIARKAAEEEAAKKAAAEAKRAKQNDQRELRRQRKRLRDLCAVEGGDGERLLDPEDVEELCRELPKSSIDSLCTSVQTCDSGEEGQRALLEAALSQVYASRGEEVARKQAARMEAAATARAQRKAALKEKMAIAKEWNEEEIRMLDKALVKFPVGVARRWEQISSYVRTRSQEEILFMVKIRQGAHASKFQQSDWRAGRKGGSNADVSVASAPDQREEAFTDVRVGIDSHQPNGVVTARSSEVSAAPDTASAPVNGKNAAPHSGCEGSASVNGSKPSDTPAKAKNENTSNGFSWSKEQELALIKALKTISKDVDDRWGKIAELVEGKDKFACARHFKEMKAHARTTKC